MRLAVFRLLLAVTPMAHADELPLPFGVTFPEVLALAADPPNRLTSYGDAPSQHRALWLPDPLPEAPRPLIVLIHGGCWLDAHGVDHVYGLASALRDRGYAVLAPEYRRVGNDGGGWPQSRDDLLAAIKPDADLEASRSYDPDEVVLVGHSAGGHLALVVAAALASDADTDPVIGVIGLAAITDPIRYAQGSGSCNRAAQLFFGGAPSDVPERYASGDPLAAWRGNARSVPVVLIQGTADPIVPMTQAEALARAPAVALRTLPDAQHFDLIHPATAAFEVLVEAIESLHDQAEE